MMKHMKKIISFLLVVCILTGSGLAVPETKTSVTISDWTEVTSPEETVATAETAETKVPREPMFPKGLLSYLSNNKVVEAYAAGVSKDFTGYVIIDGKGDVFTTGETITMDQKTMNIIVTRYENGEDKGLAGNVEVELLIDTENIIKIISSSAGALGKFYGTIEAKSPGYQRVTAYIHEKDEAGNIINTTPINCYVYVELKVQDSDWPEIDKEKVLVFDDAAVKEYKVKFMNLSEEESANAQVTWDSSNKEVATVEKGKIIPKSAGMTTITITTTTKDQSEKPKTVQFNVIVSPVGSMEENGTFLQTVKSRTAGSSLILYTNGYIAADWTWQVYAYSYDKGESAGKTLIYDSKKSSVKTERLKCEPSQLNGTVQFSSLKAGHYQVVGTVSSKYGEATWNQVVFDIIVELSFYGQPTIYMSIGDTYDIINNSNIPAELFTEILTVSKGSSGAATFSEKDGVVTAVKKGEYSLTIKYNKESEKGIYPSGDENCKKEMKHVFQVTDELILKETELHLATGVTYELDYLTNSTIDEDDIVSVRWSPSNNSNKYVNVTNGTIEALKSTEGSFVLVTVTVKMADGTTKNANCRVYVEDSITKVTVDPENVSLIKDETKWINAIPDKNIVGSKIEWRSSDTSVFEIEETQSFSARIRGVGGGVAELVAINADNVVVGFCTVTVLQEATSVEILEGNDLVYKLSQGSVQLHERVVPDNATNKKVYWESSNKKIAEVNEFGLVTFKKAGVVTIIVKTDDAKGSYAYCNITIQDVMEDIALDEDEIEMYVGESRRLSYQIDGTSENIGNKNLIWTSFDTAVVSVDGTGMVRANGPGSTQIMVRSEENAACYAICRVTVKQKAAGVKMNYTELTMDRGEYFDMEVTITPITSTEASLIWESLNPKVATVSSTGRITARAEGTAIIAVRTQSGATSYCTVTVLEPVVSLELDPTDLIIDVGEIFKIDPVFKPAAPTIQDVKWTSYNKEIATVNALGEVEGISRGSTIVTCETIDGGYRAFCLVQVIDPAIQITITPDNYRLGYGKTVMLEAKVTNHGEEVKNMPIIWESSDEDICTVDETGRVTGVDYGFATIRAEIDDEYGAYATCEIRVVREVTSIRLNHSVLTVIQGHTVSLKAEVQPSNATYTDAAFSSDDEKIAAVDEDGMITGIKPGNTWIWAKAKDNSGKYARCYVTVIEPIPSTGVTVSDKQVVLIAGESKKLVYTMKPNNTTDDLTWSSANEAIATVDGSGIITAHRNGSTTVTGLTTSGKTTSVEVIVIGLNKTSVEMALYDDRVTLYVDGATTGIKWDSDNSSIVEVNNGKLTTRKVGTTYVTATVNGRKLRCKVTVLPNDKKK